MMGILPYHVDPNLLGLGFAIWGILILLIVFIHAGLKQGSRYYAIKYSAIAVIIVMAVIEAWNYFFS